MTKSETVTDETSRQDDGAERLLQKDRAYLTVKQFLFDTESTQTIFSERALAAKLEVSLASIRSALERLRAEEMIETIPKAGIRLPQISSGDILEFYEFRIVVETYVASGIAGRLAQDQCAQLRALIAEQKEAARKRDTNVYHGLDLRFHHMLAEFHGNREMVRALSQMQDKMYRLSRRLHRTHPERLGINADQHESIVEAICSGDPLKAEEAMRLHLTWGRDFTLDPDGRAEAWPRLAKASES